MAQLSAFGVSADQIAKRTKTRRADVDAALTPGRSELARAAADRYDFLDLAQAATLAEVEDDPEAVQALVLAARTGQFAHAAQRLRDARDEARHQAEYAEALRQSGVRVIEHPGHTTTEALRLELLVGPGTWTPRATPAAPATPPTWGAPVATSTPSPATPSSITTTTGTWSTRTTTSRWSRSRSAGRPVERCGASTWSRSTCAPTPQATGTRPATEATTRAPTGRRWPTCHRSRPRRPGPSAATSSSPTRRGGRAEAVRREWVATFLTRKTAPKGAAALVGSALALHAETVARLGANHLAADLLGAAEGTTYGRSGGIGALIDQASEARAQVLGLALVLAGYEDATHIGSWRRVDDGTRRYLTFLSACGYTLSDVERRACGATSTPTD